MCWACGVAQCQSACLATALRPCVPGGDGLLVPLGQVQLVGFLGGEQAHLLVLVAEYRRPVGGQHSAPVGDDQNAPAGDGLINPCPARDERTRLDLPAGLFEDLALESLLRTVISGNPRCAVADL